MVKAGPGRDLILLVLGPCEPVGAAVFGCKSFLATAITLEVSGIFPFGRQFFELLEKHPVIARCLFTGLTMGLMNLDRHFAGMLGDGPF